MMMLSYGLWCLNGTNWCFSCLDVATHLAEEIPSPSTNIPKALVWTVVVAFGSGILMVFAILVNLGPLDANTDYTGAAVIYSITGSKASTIALWVPVLFLIFMSVWGVQTWQSRLAWTISRESGFPLHRHFSKSYSIPTLLVIWHGRKNFQHGPFWYPKLGLLANLV
ncbi:hypothetical protein F4813DRAFT_370093 [Daldinia decipiens]|uniref:uncharacterized protein n=1 Tax=Daldinia decipiens TaxID=326647 RepID=UPI0020C56B70|nr:uncharacterized protein F4813DRAFT_370093 [Daldinia decipiens]KAI1654732.1 hypothetical protein F4813DRAFT_370093 [Daldinia decipiens]